MRSAAMPMRCDATRFLPIFGLHGRLSGLVWQGLSWVGLVWSGCSFALLSYSLWHIIGINMATCTAS